MRFYITAAAAICLLSFVAFQSRAADANKTVTGVLIDQACGSTMLKDADPEKAAAAHPKSCAVKEACEKSGYAVISGKDMIKFDDNGNKLAKEFLAKTEKTDNLKVTVEGTQNGDQIAVTSLKAAE